MKPTNPACFHAGQKESILALLDRIGGDGHTIFKPDVLGEFPEELQQRFITTLHSDTSDYKSTIFDDQGNILKSIDGVYGLDVQEGILSDLGLRIRDFTGRGFRARAATDAIRHFFATCKP